MIFSSGTECPPIFCLEKRRGLDHLGRVFRISLPDLVFDCSPVTLAGGSGEPLTKLRAFFVTFASTLDLAVTFSHFVAGSPFRAAFGWSVFLDVNKSS